MPTMKPNLRSLVAKAYRVRQGRTFSSSSSSSAPNPIDDGIRYISIYEWLLTRGSATLTGYGAASYIFGDSTSKFDEKVKANKKDVVEFLKKRGKLPPSWVEDSMSKS